MKGKRLSLGISAAMLALFSIVTYVCLQQKFGPAETRENVITANFLAVCGIAILRLRRYPAVTSFLKYTMVGAMTTIVNYVTYWLMAHPLRDALGIGYNNASWIAVATTGSWLAAVVVSFFPNKAFAFDSHDWSRKVVFREGRTFFLSRVMTYVMDLLFMVIAVSCGMHDMTAKLFSSIFVVIGNFFTSQVIFKKN